MATVYEAGESADGRPYFVMELVDELPITDFCEERRMALRSRLELFIGVCEGVQHAHSKGIIHRDLKPSNVLVAVIDRKPFPKVIDFGVAKAIDQLLTQKTIYTEVGRFVGTPLYMSPEQAPSRPRAGHKQRRGRRYAQRRLLARSAPLRIAHREHSLRS